MYPPRVMLSLLIYGYRTGTFSSWKIASQLLPMLNAAFENTSKTPNCVLADAGSKNESSFALLDEMAIDDYVSVGREARKRAGPRRNKRRPRRCAAS